MRPLGTVFSGAGLSFFLCHLDLALQAPLTYDIPGHLFRNLPVEPFRKCRCPRAGMRSLSAQAVRCASDRTLGSSLICIHVGPDIRNRRHHARYPLSERSALSFGRLCRHSTARFRVPGATSAALIIPCILASQLAVLHRPQARVIIKIRHEHKIDMEGLG